MLIYNRAVNILCRYLTDKELVELANALDGDPTNGFIEILTEAVEERHPELFTMGGFADEDG